MKRTSGAIILLCPKLTAFSNRRVYLIYSMWSRIRNMRRIRN